MKHSEAALWIGCLAMVGVGLRNFEPSLTSDAPLYATIARNMVRHHEWLHMDSSLTDFRPFAEHPHLYFWILAAFFKVLPAQDWAARIPGDLFYVGTLSLLFFYIRRVVSERAALWCVILLWTWDRYGNFFSNVYLDPACVFFGIACIVMFDVANERRKTWLSGMAGVSLALAVMTKGLAAAGFLPALAVLVWVKRPTLKAAGAFAVGLALPLVGYALLVPEFFPLYWSRQVTNRFASKWSWLGVFGWRGWRLLLRDTHYLLLLAPFAFLHRWDWKRHGIPLALFGAFVGMLSMSDLAGTQYWVAVMPWVAWLAADGVFSRIPWEPSRVARITARLAVVIVFLIQFAPFNLRRLPPPEETAAIRATTTSYLLVPKDEINFLVGSRFAWYADREVRYVRIASDLETTPPEKPTLYLYDEAIGTALLEKQRLCEKQTFSRTRLWVPCPSG